MGQTGLDHRDLPADVLAALRRGGVIPAHPLALTAERRLDGAASGRCPATTSTPAPAGWRSASTPPSSRSATVGLLRAGAGARRRDRARAGPSGRWSWSPAWSAAPGRRVGEAELARGLGYHAGLLSLAALQGRDEDELIAHCAAVADVMPLVGFYLQPAVGGIVLRAAFWRRFAEIDNVVAIKIAPFNRYQTLDVVRGVVEAGAEDGSRSTPATTTTSSSIC